jgi:hypothetical protein
MTIEATHLDLVSLRKTAWRKLLAFRTVSQKRMDGQLSQEDYIARWSAEQKTAEQSKETAVMTAGLWRMESLGVTYARQTPAGKTLNDSTLPLACRPIVHVGMGAGSVEVANFDPNKITETIESLSNPSFHLFPYESLGAMLGIYEKSLPRIMLGLKPLNRPEPQGFIKCFSAEIQRLISHGYGRLLYFNSMNIAVTVRNIAARPFLQAPAAIQGMAFAYTMVNNADLWTVLETGTGFEDLKLKAAFRTGLIYGLEFWEWESPGFLRTLKPPNRNSAESIDIAQQEIEVSRARGFLAPFWVEKTARALNSRPPHE